MKAHLPHGQEEEDEDENDWGLASVSCILGTANKHFPSLKQDPVQYHMLNLIMSLFYHLFSGVYVGNYL